MHDDAENLATEYEHKKHGLQVTEAIYKPRTLNHLTSLVHEKIDMSENRQLSLFLETQYKCRYSYTYEHSPI
jgi:plasmid maintenance system killer protein